MCNRLQNIKIPAAKPVSIFQTDAFSPFWGMGGVASVWLFSALITNGMKGPDFLAYYFFLGLALMIVASISRSLFRYFWFAGLLAGLAFEGVGLIRFITGSAAGMYKFDFMFVMMVVGGIIFFINAANVDFSQFSSISIGSDSGSSGSGCGGGCGGGGGGCGGCGGS